jgi:hypothetical protein
MWLQPCWSTHFRAGVFPLHGLSVCRCPHLFLLVTGAVQHPGRPTGGPSGDSCTVPLATSNHHVQCSHPSNCSATSSTTPITTSSSYCGTCSSSSSTALSQQQRHACSTCTSWVEGSSVCCLQLVTAGCSGRLPRPALAVCAGAGTP